MVWQNARWRWALLALGVAVGCLLAFTTEPGAASSPVGPADHARLAVSTAPGGATRVTLPQAESSSTLDRVRWAYAAVAAAAILFVGAIQYRAFRRLQERRLPAPTAARPRWHRRQFNPAGAHSVPLPVAERHQPSEPGWAAGLSLRPGIGD